MDCLFCKIIKGEIPSAKVFENEFTFAFLDINPLTRGHCLVVPKQHFENIFDIDENILSEVSKTAKIIAQKIKDNLGATGVNLVNASGKDADQDVFHFHLHIIPRKENDGLQMHEWWLTKTKKQGLEELRLVADEIIEK